MKQFLALQGPQPPTPAESDFRSLTALQKWDAEVYGFQLPVSEFQQTWDSAPDGRVEKPRDFPGSEIFMTIMNGTTKYTRIPVPALLSLRRIVGLPRFGPWVTGTRVDVRNLKVRFRSSQISFARHFTRQLRPFHRPKCPSEKHHPWPNWRCANSDLSAESNASEIVPYGWNTQLWSLLFSAARLWLYSASTHRFEPRTAHR